MSISDHNRGTTGLQGWLTAANAAELLNWSPRRVKRACRSGLIPAHKLGNRLGGEWLIDPIQLRAAVMGHERIDAHPVERERASARAELKRRISRALELGLDMKPLLARFGNPKSLDAVPDDVLPSFRAHLIRLYRRPA